MPLSHNAPCPPLRIITIGHHAFNKKEIKSVDFFDTSQTPHPSPKVWKISGNFAVKKGQKLAKICKQGQNQNTLFSHFYESFLRLPLLQTLLTNCPKLLSSWLPCHLKNWQLILTQSLSLAPVNMNIFTATSDLCSSSGDTVTTFFDFDGSLHRYLKIINIFMNSYCSIIDCVKLPCREYI